MIIVLTFVLTPVFFHIYSDNLYIIGLSKNILVKSFRRFKEVGLKEMGLVFLSTMYFWVIDILYGIVLFACTLESFIT